MNSSIFKRHGNETLSDSSTIVAGAGGLVHLSHPCSSTPALSTLVNAQKNYCDMIGINSQKVNMKLPVEGSSANNNSSNELVNKPLLALGGVRQRQNVTVRERYNYSSTDTSMISPIIPASDVRSTVQFTDPRGFRKLFSAEEQNMGESVPGSGNSSGPKKVFPYPKVAFDALDTADVVCQMLKTLNAYNIIEGEKQRLHGLKKRKEKPEEVVVPYDFQQDTFTAVNSEAANYALHLIFNTIDPKETEHKFRDCWPVFEKKLEGVFRRVALDWIKQLVEDNQVFFQDVRIEAIGGLLVNPGGDRFISFLRQLCRFALFTLANKKKGVIKEQVLLPPTPTSDPEISNRQMHVLYHRLRRHAEALPENYQALIKSDLAFSLRLRIMDENHQHIQRQNSMQSARLMGYVHNYPELFGNPTEEELKAREETVASTKLCEIKEGEFFNDFLHDRLLIALKKRSEEVYKPVSQLHDVIEYFGSLWHILEMDKSAPAVIDCSKFLPDLVENTSGTRSINALLKSFVSTVNSMVSSKYLNSKTPADILQEYQAVSCRFRFLEMMQSDIVKKIPCDSQVVKRAELQCKVLKPQMDVIDWSLLSQISEKGINHLLDITPLRIYDINRTSGRTPGINNFLDSSSSSSSGEHQHTSIVRRRNAQLLKTKPARKIQRSISDVTENVLGDVTDGQSSSRTDCKLGNTVATPLSSTQNQMDGSSIRCSSLFRDSIIETPASTAPSSASSFRRMRKSVSFGDTPSNVTGEFSFASSVRQYVRRSSSRFSSGNSSFSTGTPSNMLDTSLGMGNRDSLSRLSFASSVGGTPVGLDTSTQDRLKKLMESVAPKNHIRSNSRSSLSPILSSEADATDAANMGIDNIHLPPSPILNDAENKNIIVNNLEGETSNYDADGDFGDISIIEDLEGIKGIMETSYVEFFRNSDSDD